MQPRSLITPLAVALATCAIGPAVASAGPIIEGQGVAAGGGPGVTAQQFAPRSLAAPDQVDRVTSAPQTSAAPTWPNGPLPLATRQTQSPVVQSDDDGGVDVGVWIALGGAAFLASGGMALAGRKRLQVVRRRQLA